MSKLEPLNVTAKPCPECGSDSTSQTDNHFDPETRCLYETYECDTCGRKWAEKFICEGDVEGLKIYDISGDEDDEPDFDQMFIDSLPEDE